jgi:TolB-like protein
MKKISLALPIMIVILAILQAGNLSAETIAVLPFYSLGIEEISIQTAESILKNDIQKLSSMHIISQNKTIESLAGEKCTEVVCAVEIGKKLDADLVLITNLSKLGEKIIIQYNLVDVNKGQSTVLDNTTSNTIEDLEVVMKRIAMSVVEQKPLAQTVEVGAIMEKEDDIPKRRSARRFWGLSFGYLYPQQGYDEDYDRSFTIDLRSGYEVGNIAVGLQLAARHGFASNIYTSYLFSKKDLCPYVGGALGFHWVVHDDWYDSRKQTDGLEFIANAGIRAFRTYNFQVILNIDYAITFNDYDDRALIITIGLLK